MRNGRPVHQVLLDLYLGASTADVREPFHAELLSRLTRQLYEQATDWRSQWLRPVLAGLEHLAGRMEKRDPQAWKLLSAIAAVAPPDHPLVAGYPRHRRLALSPPAWYLRDRLAEAIVALNDPGIAPGPHEVTIAAVLAARMEEPRLLKERLSALPEARVAGVLAVAFDLVFATCLTTTRLSAARPARVRRWERVIRRALDRARGGAGELAQVLVAACLRELGHREPSRAWGARRAARWYRRKGAAREQSPVAMR